MSLYLSYDSEDFSRLSKVDRLLNKLKEESWVRREKAVKKLGMLKNKDNKKAIDALVGSLTDPSWYLRYISRKSFLFDLMFSRNFIFNFIKWNFIRDVSKQAAISLGNHDLSKYPNHINTIIQLVDNSSEYETFF